MALSKRAIGVASRVGVETSGGVGVVRVRGLGEGEEGGAGAGATSLLSPMSRDIARLSRFWRILSRSLRRLRSVTRSAACAGVCSISATAATMASAGIPAASMCFTAVAMMLKAHPSAFHGRAFHEVPSCDPGQMPGLSAEGSSGLR